MRMELEAVPDVYVGNVDLDVVDDSLHQLLHETLVLFGSNNKKIDTGTPQNTRTHPRAREKMELYRRMFSPRCKLTS